MAWVRIDDQIAHHPKFIAAGPIASWLWVCGSGYCSKYLTDGFIPATALKTLGDVTGPTKWAERLADVGLWARVDGGYQVHDFLDYNPSAAEVKAKREQDRLRKQHGIHEESKGNPTGIAVDSARIPIDASRAPASRPVPIRVPGVKNTPGVPPKEPADPRAKEFIDWFQAEYKIRRHGAAYLVDWGKDTKLVKAMLGATELPRLKLLAQILLSDKCDEEWIVNTDRGIGILKSKFNWLSDRLAEWETRKQVKA